ncbi:MAG: response regulator [Deltaproteobacteria bacterium]|nr:response regulator [Deltaproteobacteria bacterium]MBW2017524.1 response regulator [Deltaproteobacteria bacterium]MBW2130296.1 response regulator [Deltaproteobacteria bacterium]MBW2302622.1 response regulator [Deltaproteobacteria bacterium]
MPLKRKHTILLVDDEAAIINALQRLLRREGFNIHSASNGKEALEVLKKLGKRVSLIISDQRMPGMTGCEFLEKAKEMAPDAMRFLLTGYTDMDVVVEAINRGGVHRYINKPWNDKEFRLQVIQALEQYELVLENRRLTLLTKKQNRILKELNQNLEKKVKERTREIIEKNRTLSRMNKELESSFFNTVRAFASLAEMHAPLLAGHGRRVSLLARDIALMLELPENDVNHIEVAGLLHDVGKLGLPDKVLNYQEEAWSEEDKVAYHRHPEEGQTIVRFINRLGHVGLLIRSHHERYDGLGYPDRLSEETIPLGSRIIAVANAYDKIAHLRVNGKSLLSEYLRERDTTADDLPRDELYQQAALFHLKKHAFTHFDPDVVKSLLGVLKTRGIRYKQEQLVPVEDLRPGMVLTRSIYTKGGRFLLPHNTTLTRDYIQKLQEINKRDPVLEGVYIMGE